MLLEAGRITRLRLCAAHMLAAQECNGDILESRPIVKRRVPYQVPLLPDVGECPCCQLASLPDLHSSAETLRACTLRWSS